jgi:hypothetical protein
MSQPIGRLTVTGWSTDHECINEVKEREVGIPILSDFGEARIGEKQSGII